MARIPTGGNSVDATGWVKVADVDSPAGVVSSKVWQDAPNNTILQSCQVTDLDVEVSVKSAFPKVTVNATPAVLVQSADGGHYEGDVAVTLVGAGPVTVVCETPNGQLGADDSVQVGYVAPPQLLTLSFVGGYPGSQTELKAGDAFQITGTTDKDADAVQIQTFGAMVQSLETFVSGTIFTVSGTIADQGDVAQFLSARVRARDSVTGGYGPIVGTNLGGGGVDGTDVVNCNDLHPTVTLGAPSYPGIQEALKGSETSNVAVSTSNLDSILFDSQTNELSITNPTLDEATKTISRIAGGYNTATPNLRVTATRAANDADTVDTAVVKIANDAATVAMVGPAARLRSGGNDGTAVQDHSISLQANQQLLSAPSASEGVGGGTFIGAWAGGPATWTRTLQVSDDDTKGNYDWTGLSATNLAGVVTVAFTGSTQYTLGGFVSRTLTFAAFATTASMDVEVVDFAKLTASVFTSTGQTALKQAIGTPPSVTDGYTIQAAAVKPTIVVWLDTPAASANSSGTAQITNVEETV